ncbi:gamma-glutamylcyclotransferase family protein [Paenibacillus paeoniae]|uniref:Gamma-glutamylcyclotransferase n=1 Tax=Paenibacillus paeoniae TaxID=2292705 RepID=A0A371PIZ2_9BACL|nr:gamma-glutamylcyclotransferase family protein [Paenibacillus paeoniae]REK75747.1 gamma-glutamylcyclotransferase [Paenibacillus paeoniae]
MRQKAGDLLSVIRVFIYGSLLPGQSNHHVVSRYVKSDMPGMIAGRLVDFGPYPAAVRDHASRELKSTIRGQWITVDRQGLAAMDMLEDFYGVEERNEYDRIWVSDLESPGLAGWVYVWDTDRGYPAIAGGYWPAYAARKSG